MYGPDFFLTLSGYISFVFVMTRKAFVSFKLLYESKPCRLYTSTNTITVSQFRTLLSESKILFSKTQLSKIHHSLASLLILDGASAAPFTLEISLVSQGTCILQAYFHLGINEKLGLSGRPDRPIGCLGTSKVSVCFAHGVALGSHSAC